MRIRALSIIDGAAHDLRGIPSVKSFQIFRITLLLKCHEAPNKR